jgi:tRNA modification GTPase
MAGAASLLAGGEDTIVALATAGGRGALAVIRVSGARARDIARALGVSALDRPAAVPRRVHRARLVHPIDGALLDDALVTWFRAPHSFTGEEVVEFATHGGTIAPTRVIAACVAAGARPAFAGEFTRRALLHGKLDLLQAEAIADVIDARTTALHQQALTQLDGGLSRRLLALREAIIHVEALLAYDVDFPEEDDGPIDRRRIDGAAQAAETALAALLRTAPAGAMVRDGALVVFAGAPNVGKSSLFNALLGESRAIVTPIAGTTRDAIEALLDRTPVPLRLVDTAGLRDTTDALERLGIEVSARYLAQAQVVVACETSVEGLRQLCDELTRHTAAPIVAVLTKQERLDDPAAAARALPALSASGLAVRALSLSAETGDGLAALLTAIDDALAPATQSDGGDVAPLLITRERHRLGLATALDELRAFRTAWGAGALPATVAAIHLFAAREALSDLIGVVEVDDVLDRVFRDFCIGK